MKSKSIWAAAGLCVLVAAVLAVYFTLRPQPQAGIKNIRVEVFAGDKAVRVHEVRTDAVFLRQALEENGLVAGTESGYGLYVTTVDGVTADESRQQWWRLTRAGQELMTGVDDTPVTDGDRYEITLTTGY